MNHVYTYSDEAIAYSKAKLAWRESYKELTEEIRSAKRERIRLYAEEKYLRAAAISSSLEYARGRATEMMAERTQLTDDWKALLANGHVARWRNEGFVEAAE